jgi:hypothetical protein
MYKLVLDELPDDPGHLIAVHLNDRVYYSYFGLHAILPYKNVGANLKSLPYPCQPTSPDPKRWPYIIFIPCLYGKILNYTYWGDNGRKMV